MLGAGVIDHRYYPEKDQMPWPFASSAMIDSFPPDKPKAMMSMAIVRTPGRFWLLEAIRSDKAGFHGPPMYLITPGARKPPEL